MAGLIDAIINPAQANVLGAVQAGKQQRSKDMAGEILSQTFTGKLGALAKIDPDMSLRLSKELNIPTDSKGRFQNLIGTAVAANQLVKAGMPNEAAQFILEQGQKLESLAGQGTSQRMTDLANRLQAGDPNAVRELEAFASIGQPGVSAKEQAEIQNLKVKTDEIRQKIAEKATGSGAIEFKDFRSLNNDVTELLKEPAKIRRAAERLEKISETKSPTDQLAAIFTFMKTLDPTSVVREGEQQSARQTGGVTDAFIGFIEQIKGEGGLPPSVFDNMVDTARRLSNQASTGAQAELQSSLDAFGSRLQASDKVRLMNRVPELFVGSPEAAAAPPIGSVDNGDGTFTMQDGTVIRRKQNAGP